MKNRFVIYVLAAFFGGCASEGGDIGVGGEVVIGQKLPDGWQLVPKSQLPTSCKMPWWVENPIVMEGQAARDAVGVPERMSKLVGVMYAKDGWNAGMICIVYQDAAAASAEWQTMKDSPDDLKRRVGFLNGRDDALVILHMEMPDDCPDRKFFEDYFSRIASRPSQ